MAGPVEISKLLNDREFHDLPIKDKLEILRTNYPDYAALNAKDQGTLLNEFDAKVRPVADGKDSRPDTGPGPLRSFLDKTPLGGVIAHGEGMVKSVQDGDYLEAAKHAGGIASGGMSDLPDMAWNMGANAVEHGRRAIAAPTVGGKLAEAGYAVPVVGQLAESVANDAKNDNPAGLWGTALTLGMGAPGVSEAVGGTMGRVGATVRGAAKSGLATPSMNAAGELQNAHLGLVDRGVRAFAGGRRGWESTAPTVTAPGEYFPADESHMRSAPAAEVPPVAPTASNVERVPGRMQLPSTAGYPQPRVEVPPVEQVPGRPAPIPQNHPLARVQDLGPDVMEPHPDPAYPTPWGGPQGPGPRETPPGGAWGKGYRATKAPGVGPLEEPSGGWPDMKYAQAPPETAQIPPVTTKALNNAQAGVPPVQTTGEPVRTENLQIPNRYQSRNNPSAAHNVDKRIAAELQSQGVSGNKITPQHIENAKTKLGHLRATPKLADIQATMKEMGFR